MHTNDMGCIEFSGRYPQNILEETNNYSIVAGGDRARVRF